MNGIVSMIPGLADADKEELVLSFCEKLSKASGQQHGMVALKVSFLFVAELMFEGE